MSPPEFQCNKSGDSYSEVVIPVELGRLEPYTHTPAFHVCRPVCQICALAQPYSDITIAWATQIGCDQPATDACNGKASLLWMKAKYGIFHARTA
jgi:hypothetical protein